MSMGSGSNDVQETPQQKVQMQVASQQMQDWNTRWLPQLTNFSKQIDQSMAPGSSTRAHATSLAGADTTARYAQAGQQALAATAAGGAIGSAKQKLGITGMGDDEATTTGMGSMQADQSVDAAGISGYKAVAALGRGEKATATDAINNEANLSGQVAANDAENSLQQRAGFASLGGKIAGTGAGLWMGGSKPPGIGLGGGTNFQTPMDYSSGMYGTPQAGV